MRFSEKLLKQNNTGVLIGGVKEVLAHTVFWVSMMQFGLVAVTTYNTTIYPYVKGNMSWFSFWMFAAILVVIVLIAMLIEWKFIIPSVLTFRNQQAGKFEWPTKKEIENIAKNLKAVQQKLGIDWIEDEDTPAK